MMETQSLKGRPIRHEDVPTSQAATCPQCGLQVSPPGSFATHPLAQFFDRLWTEKTGHHAVELHLCNGETLIPDRFAPELSRQSYGVFAVAEPGGTHTMTTVAWASVARVLVRGVKELPPEMGD